MPETVARPHDNPLTPAQTARLETDVYALIDRTIADGWHSAYPSYSVPPAARS